MRDTDQTSTDPIALPDAPTTSTEGALPINTDPSKRMAYGLKAGFAWNPWAKWPPNLYCVCGSGKKFKKCHMNNVSPAILVTDLERATAEFKNAVRHVQALKNVGLIFKKDMGLNADQQKES